MAWHSHGINMKTMVESLVRNGIFKNPRAVHAMALSDRADFVTPETIGEAYKDHPLSLGYGATISAPHMHAFCLEYAAEVLAEGDSVLDVGSGSGVLLPSFSYLVGGKGIVTGIEHIPQLVASSMVNLRKHFHHLLDDHLIVVIEGDGRVGYPGSGPYKLIHVGAASDDEAVAALSKQLAPGGRLIIPHKDTLKLIDRSVDGGTTFLERSLFGVRYVPLCAKASQLGDY